MKKILSIVTASVIAISLFPQKAQIKAGYNYHYFDPRGIEKNHDFILLAGQNCSKFYNSHSQWLDSIRCTKDGEQWHNQQALIMIGELMNKSREENLTFLKPIITDATYFTGRLFSSSFAWQ